MTAGRLEAIWIKRAKGRPMDPVEKAEAISGQGLVGNANQRGHRQVTVLSRESWEAAAQDLADPDLDPILRRANLLIRGIELPESRDRILRIGGTRILIRGETRPCRAMDEAHPGLRLALDPYWRAGAYGEVLEDGELALGDTVTWD